MTVSPDTLLAFIDGELSPEEARRVAVEVANDPALSAHAESHRALKARLQAASRPLPETARSSAPETIVALPPLGLGAPPTRRPEPLPAARTQAGMSWLPAAAMAIGIALGLLLAITFTPGTQMRTGDGKATAQGALARALSTLLVAEEVEANGTTRIGESFFSNDGYFCRNFTTAGKDGSALSGIACREGEDWRIRALASAVPGDDGKPPDMPAAIRSALNSLIVGKALDDEGERAARAQGWLAH